MKVTWATALFLLCSSGVTSLPTESQTDLVEHFGVPGDYVLENLNELEKRRGGGGGKGGGGSSGGSSGGRSGSSSGGSSGGSSSRGGSSSGSTSRTSNTGGTTSKGSGVTPSYGNGRYDTPNYYSGDYYGQNGYSEYERGSDYSSGFSYPKTGPKTRPAYGGRTYGESRYYAGGATTPYRAGRTSALGIAPFLLPVAALAFFPLLWYHPVYVYPYNDTYNYHDDNTNKNESLPVKCLCEQYQECGCDNNNNSTYYESLFNGTQPRNTTMVRLAEVNGTESIWINGTLENGTTAADGSSSAASGPMSTLIYSSGYWVTAVLVTAMVWTV